MVTMAKRSGWDTIFAEPIRWSRKDRIRKCLAHIILSACFAIFIVLVLELVLQGHLWVTQMLREDPLLVKQRQRYQYNVKNGPFVLSEQEIVDTRSENLSKQYVQVHHGTALRLETIDVGCGSDRCKPMIFQFKKHAAHDPNINQLVVMRPLPYSHPSYSVRHPINFNAMPAKKLMAILRAIGVEKHYLRGMEKSGLVSLISTAYESDPKYFNYATESHVLVGFLTDFSALSVYKKAEYMDLVLDTCNPYSVSSSNIPSTTSTTKDRASNIPTKRFEISIMIGAVVLFVMMIAYSIFEIVQTWVSSSRILTSFGSTEFQKRILEPLKHIAQSEGWQANTSLSIYELAALKLQEKLLFSDEIYVIVNKENFRLFLTNKHLIYVRNDVVDVIFVSEIDDIRARSDTFYVVLSSGQWRTLNMSPDQADHMRNVLSSRSERFRQLEEPRRVKRQQEEEERLRRQREEEEIRRRVEAEREARRREEEETIRRRRQQEETIRRRRQQEETIRRINEFLTRLAERANERQATEEIVGEMRGRAFELKMDSEENCVICQDDMKKGQMVIPFPCPAKHQFHEDCMLQFLQHGSSCPLCRHQVEHDPADDNAYLGVLQHLFT